MKSCSNIEIRRCRPLLGTFVEVAAFGRKAADLERGIDAAFTTIEKVCCLMSYHDPQSDVSRMNREAFPKSVVVDPWTWQVLHSHSPSGYSRGASSSSLQIPGDSQPAHSLTRGNSARSTIATRAPAFVKMRAHVLPAGPPARAPRPSRN